MGSSLTGPRTLVRRVSHPRLQAASLLLAGVAVTLPGCYAVPAGYVTAAPPYFAEARVYVAPVVTRRISAFSCFPDMQPAGGGLNVVAARRGAFDPHQSEGLGPRVAGTSLTLYCPVPSDSLLEYRDVDKVLVHGHAASDCSIWNPNNCPPYTRAFLCVSFGKGIGGTCTGFRLAEVRGAEYEIEFNHQSTDFEPWMQFPDGYAYVRVEQPGPSDNGDTPSLRGITIIGTPRRH